MNVLTRSTIAAAAVLAFFACSKPAARDAGAVSGVIRVSAAASLTAPFQELAARFETTHPGAKVELNCVGSQQLVLQIREGSPVDVLATADQVNMQKVVVAGDAIGAPIEFAQNHLAIVVAAGNPKQITALTDLTRDGLRVAFCGPEVPAGRYAREALAKAKLDVRSVSDEPSVKAAVTKVQLGEIDAAVTYVTDARGKGLQAVPLAAEHDVVATYPIVAIKTGANAAGGAAFVQFVRSDAGRGVLRTHGFSVP